MGSVRFKAAPSSGEDRPSQRIRVHATPTPPPPPRWLLPRPPHALPFNPHPPPVLLASRYYEQPRLPLSTAHPSTHPSTSFHPSITAPVHKKSALPLAHALTPKHDRDVKHKEQFLAKIDSERFRKVARALVVQASEARDTRKALLAVGRAERSHNEKGIARITRLQKLQVAFGRGLASRVMASTKRLEERSHRRSR